jgi:hypothetical protein
MDSRVERLGRSDACVVPQDSLGSANTSPCKEVWAALQIALRSYQKNFIHWAHNALLAAALRVRHARLNSSQFCPGVPVLAAAQNICYWPQNTHSLGRTAALSTRRLLPSLSREPPGDQALRRGAIDADADPRIGNASKR